MATSGVVEVRKGKIGAGEQTAMYTINKPQGHTASGRKNNGKSKNMDAVNFPSLEYFEIMFNS